MPATGTPGRGVRSAHSPYTSLDERISGRHARGMPKARSSPSSHSHVSSRMSSEREAFVTSVTCTPPRGPPVSCQVSHVSIVPKQSSPASARSRAPGTSSSSHASFVAEKYGFSGSPVASRNRSTPPSAASRSTIGCERVSCHTIAGCTGRPVARSQSTVVSR